MFYCFCWTSKWFMTWLLIWFFPRINLRHAFFFLPFYLSGWGWNGRKKDFSNRSSPISEEGCLTDRAEARLHKATFITKPCLVTMSWTSRLEGCRQEFLAGKTNISLMALWHAAAATACHILFWKIKVRPKSFWVYLAHLDCKHKNIWKKCADMNLNVFHF